MVELFCVITNYLQRNAIMPLHNGLFDANEHININMHSGRRKHWENFSLYNEYNAEVPGNLFQLSASSIKHVLDNIPMHLRYLL